MTRDLYEPCWLCQGTGKTTAPAMVDGLKRPGKKPYSGPLPVGSPCPGCAGSETPGFAKIGLTTPQVEGIAAHRDKLKGFALALAHRVADQSELLTCRAERPAVSLTETDHYPEG